MRRKGYRSAAAPGVRLRLGSLEPGTVTEDFASGALAAPQPLRPLSPVAAERLRRDAPPDEAEIYTADGVYARPSALLRRCFPDCGLTADLIVGFPGETDAEFEETLAFIRQCAFSSMHIFPLFRPAWDAGGEAMPDSSTRPSSGSGRGRAAEAARDMARSYRKSFRRPTLEVLIRAGGEARRVLSATPETIWRCPPPAGPAPRTQASACTNKCLKNRGFFLVKSQTP